MTREEALEILKGMKYPYNYKNNKMIISNLNEETEALEMAISALDNKTPCSLCRFVDDDSDLCDMCPAMPNERGAE